jgi:hypothetical protein
MADDGGVLENLPRSRPGKRSEKRATADAEPAGEAPEPATERPVAAAAEAAERAETAPPKPSDRAQAKAEADAPSEAAPPKPSDRARATAEAASETPPKPSDRARAKRASSERARAERRRARPAPSGRRRASDPVREEPSSGHPDPVGGLIRGAVKVAGTGVRVAGAVAGEVVRRLPRP